MQKEKKIQPVSKVEIGSDVNGTCGTEPSHLMLALSENRPNRIAEAHAITTGLIQRLLDAPRPVIIVWEGLIQNVIGLDKFHILDFDSLSDMTCPFCLERDLPFPHEELWLCPHCGTDLNGYQYDDAFQAHKQAAMIVNQIRSKWKRARLVHGAPGEEKTN